MRLLHHFVNRNDWGAQAAYLSTFYNSGVDVATLKIIYVFVPVYSKAMILLGKKGMG